MAVAPYKRRINSSARRLGWSSLVLLFLGVWLVISGANSVRTDEYGRVTYSLTASFDPPAYADYLGPTWWSSLTSRQLEIGLTLGVLGLLGAIALFAFSAWRSETGAELARSASSRSSANTGTADGSSPISGSTSPTVVLPPSTGTIPLKIIAAVLAVLAALLIISGLQFETQAYDPYATVSMTNVWDSFAPRQVAVGIAAAALSVFIVLVIFAFGAWRFEAAARRVDV